MTRAALLLSLLLAVAACGDERSRRPQPLEGIPAPVEAAMDSVYGRFVRAYDLLEADSVAALYTVDALYLPADGDALRGRRAIRASFDNFFRRVRSEGVAVRIDFASVDRRGTDRLAYDVGYYVLEYLAGGEPFATSRGKFATVWRRGADERWRIHVDSFSPAPAPRADSVAAADTLGANVPRGDTAPRR